MATSTKAHVAAFVQSDAAPLVYLDANVLLPLYLRATFLDLADAEIIRVYWSEQILEPGFSI